MVFSSLLFLCIFLPLCIGFYYILPGRFKNVGLLAASLIFYGWGEPVNILIMLSTIVFHYLIAIAIARFIYKDRLPKVLLFIAICVSIGVLFFFKFTVLPIGISFFTFQTLSYTIDVYRRQVEPQKNILDLALYISLFPQLIAGPIVRYKDIAEELRERSTDPDMFFSGLFRFCLGLGKKVILANQIGLLWTEISGYFGVMPAATAWIGALSFAFQIYFDFSGYSDMAIGLGLIFGFHFPENFRYPYESVSITDFWRRWHMTLSGWFRDYVYIPLGGSRKGLPRQIINLLIVWTFTGIWHGAGWNFLLWGLYYFVLLLMEKLFIGKLLKKLPGFISHIYSLFFILLGWVIFACEDTETLGSYMTSLFGAHGGADTMSIYYLTTYALLFVILIIGSTHLPAALSRSLTHFGDLRDDTKLSTTEIISVLLQAVMIAVVLAISFTLLIGDSYNPFLYFRF